MRKGRREDGGREEEREGVRKRWEEGRKGGSE